MKVCICCSAGGHLTEAKQVLPILKNKAFFVTAKRKDTESVSGVRFISDPGRNPLRLLINIFQSLLVIIKENPDVIISTGAGIAVPLIIIGRIIGKKIIFIESFCRIEKPSLSGRISYYFSDLFLVQWPELLKMYGNRAKYWGQII